MTVHTGANAGTYFYTYDGNGNVASLINAADGTSAAEYEYGPFGELLRATGPLASVNPFRFSTKYTDDETDLVYYGYRYYNASSGRWLSRDPIEEDGGYNLYAFVHSNAIMNIDAKGLKIIQGPTAAIFAWIARFNVNDENIDLYRQAYWELTGRVPGSMQDYNTITSNLKFGIASLADSFNKDPGSSFNPFSQHTRGWLQMSFSIDCHCGNVKDGEAAKAERFMKNSLGYTPMGPIFSGGLGNATVQCRSFGAGVVCDAKERTQVGRPGYNIASTLFPGAGVPFRWSRIQYFLYCKGNYAIYYSASHFPSHRAFLEGTAVATSNQSDLHRFMFAGSQTDAPGGAFHVERGVVK